MHRLFRRSRLPGLRGLSPVLCGVLVLASWGTPSAADLKSPDLAKTGLHILAGVYGDMDRKLAAGQFDRLPHENQEFQEGSQALRDAIANEPAEFKARVAKQLDTTLTASQHVADVSKQHDSGEVKSALAALAQQMRALNALFPAALRAEPGTVEPPHHRGGK